MERIGVLTGGGGTHRRSMRPSARSSGGLIKTRSRTIDNDIKGTDYSIGFDSAITVVAEALDRLHTTGCSHHRIMLLEVMGRDAGQNMSPIVVR